MQRVIILFIVLLGIAGILWYAVPKKEMPLSLIGNGSSQEQRIELREEGFFPSALTIRKGDSVRFTTSRGKEFWPASDLHPSHEVYPEFDPRKPVKPDSSWTFQFEKTGTWHFHDHLAPLFRGVITVK